MKDSPTHDRLKSLPKQKGDFLLIFIQYANDDDSLYLPYPK